MNICIYGASSNSIDKSYIEITEDFGRLLALRGHSLVFGAGTAGLMGAAARGAASGGGRITGVAPSFFNTDGVLFDGCTELIRTDTMRERKRLMEERSDAFVCLPGGIGTFDEFFEILTLKQLGRHQKPVAVFNQNGYYDGLNSLIANAVREGFMTEAGLSLCRSFDEAGALLDYIEGYVPERHDVSEFKNI